MRQAGTIPNEADAARFGDYLLSIGVDARIDRADGQFTVWIRDEDRFSQAKDELEQFLGDPNDAKYTSAAAVAEKVRKQKQAEEKQFRKNYVNVSRQWTTHGAAGRPFTIALVAVSILVAVVSRLGQQHEPVLNWLTINSYESVDVANGIRISWRPGLPDIRSGQIWRLVTPIFIHYGILHILFNMLWMVQLGGLLEQLRGTVRFAFLVLTIAVLSNVAQYISSGPTFGGMSGVVFGLFGYAWMKSRYDPGLGIYVPPNLVLFMIAFMFLCMTGMIGNIANAAHTVGLVTGIVIGVAPVVWRKLMA